MTRLMFRRNVAHETASKAHAKGKSGDRGNVVGLLADDSTSRVFQFQRPVELRPDKAGQRNRRVGFVIGDHHNRRSAVLSDAIWDQPVIVETEPHPIRPGRKGDVEAVRYIVDQAQTGTTRCTKATAGGQRSSVCKSSACAAVWQSHARAAARNL